jgi:hypothetical protein
MGASNERRWLPNGSMYGTTSKMFRSIHPSIASCMDVDIWMWRGLTCSLTSTISRFVPKASPKATSFVSHLLIRRTRWQDPETGIVCRACMERPHDGVGGTDSLPQFAACWLSARQRYFVGQEPQKFQLCSGFKFVILSESDWETRQNIAKEDIQHVLCCFRKITISKENSPSYYYHTTANWK